MDSSSLISRQNPSKLLSREAVPLLVEGIAIVLSRWTALQIAVENGWGGRDSRRKSEELGSAILSWFTQVKEPLYIDDLENLLDESMDQSFNTEINDGSVEEVAEKLMIIHEDLMQGNYTSIENLRKTSPATNALSLSRQAVDDNIDETSEEEGSHMSIDEPPGTEFEEATSKLILAPDEDGWSFVRSRHHRGKRTGKDIN